MIAIRVFAVRARPQNFNAEFVLFTRSNPICAFNASELERHSQNLYSFNEMQ